MYQDLIFYHQEIKLIVVMVPRIILNIIETTEITSNSGSLASINIDSSCLNWFHIGMTAFALSYDDYYKVKESLIIQDMYF